MDDIWLSPETGALDPLSTDAPTAILAHDGTIIDVNLAWQRFGAENGHHDYDFGRGQNYMELCAQVIGPETIDAMTVADGLRRILRGESKSFFHEYPCHSASKERWFRLIALPKSGQEGGGAVVIHANVTEQVMGLLESARAGRQDTRHIPAALNGTASASDTGKALTQQLMIFSSALRDVPDAVVFADLDLKISLVNPAAVKTFGYRRAELIGQDPIILYANRREYEQQLSERYNPEAGYAPTPLRATYRRKDGSTFEGEITGSTMRDHDGEPLGYIGIIRDVTARVNAERKRAEALASLEQSSRAKSYFLASVSHELRTPLNAILGFSEAMRMELHGGLGDEKYRGYAADIHNSGQYLLDLVDGILDISAIEAGSRELCFENVDLRTLSEECLRTLAGQAERVGLSLSLEAPDGLPPVIGDRKSLKQIVINLLSNAVKFTPADGHVALQLAENGDDLIITVIDTGRGIDAEDISRITQPFERGKVNPYSTPDGTGLGLAITDALVTLHGGDMDFDSVVGHGTTVTVRLPRCPMLETPPA